MKNFEKTVTDYEYFVQNQKNNQASLVARSELTRAYSLNGKHQEACDIYRSVLEQRMTDKDQYDALVAAEQYADSLTKVGLHHDASRNQI